MSMLEYEYSDLTLLPVMFRYSNERYVLVLMRPTV
jgi:hypothetical protein